MFDIYNEIIHRSGRNLSCKPNIYVFQSELRVRLVPCNWFMPSSKKIFYLPFQGGSSFVDRYCLFCCFTSHVKAMVKAGQSVYLTLVFFLAKLEQAVNQYFMHIYTFACN